MFTTLDQSSGCLASVSIGCVVTGQILQLVDTLPLFEQEVLWRADWVVFCLAGCLYPAPHPSVCPGHHCLPLRHIHCGCQCAKVSRYSPLKNRLAHNKSLIFALLMWCTVYLSQETCDDNLNITMCPLCDGVCDYWRLSTVCSLARASYLFDNGATVLFAIFMSLWGNYAFKYISPSSAQYSAAGIFS